jgi:hypothetical protein
MMRTKSISGANLADRASFSLAMQGFACLTHGSTGFADRHQKDPKNEW